MTDYTIYLQILLMLLAIAVTALVINYASQKTGRDTQKDIKTIREQLEVVKKAAEDGKITEDEIEGLQEAITLIAESVKPYVDEIVKSGILSRIYAKFKAWVTG